MIVKKDDVYMCDHCCHTFPAHDPYVRWWYIGVFPPGMSGPLLDDYDACCESCADVIQQIVRELYGEVEVTERRL